jgi:adenine-specific DNA methylase
VNPLGPLLPKTEKIAEEVKMWQKSPESLTQMDERRDKKDRVGMQIANPDLIVQAKALEEQMNRNPKSPLEKIFEYNDLTGLGIGDAF